MPLHRSLIVMPRYLNPLLRPIAGYLPPLALLHHRGRRSGRSYETPVQAFRTPQGYIAAFVGMELVPAAVAAITRALDVQGFLQFDAAPSQ